MIYGGSSNEGETQWGHPSCMSYIYQIKNFFRGKMRILGALRYWWTLHIQPKIAILEPLLSVNKWISLIGKPPYPGHSSVHGVTISNVYWSFVTTLLSFFIFRIKIVREKYFGNLNISTTGALWCMVLVWAPSVEFGLNKWVFYGLLRICIKFEI